MTTDASKRGMPRSRNAYSNAKRTLEELGVPHSAWFPRKLQDVDNHCWSSLTTTCYATVALVLAIIATASLIMNNATSVIFLTFMLPALIGIGWWSGTSAIRSLRLYSYMSPLSSDDKAALFQGDHNHIAKQYQVLLPMVGRTHLIEDDVVRIYALLAAKEGQPPTDGHMAPAVA